MVMTIECIVRKSGESGFSFVKKVKVFMVENDPQVMRMTYKKTIAYFSGCTGHAATILLEQ